MVTYYHIFIIEKNTKAQWNDPNLCAGERKGIMEEKKKRTRYLILSLTGGRIMHHLLVGRIVYDNGSHRLSLGQKY
jgi:hypothetical protein